MRVVPRVVLGILAVALGATAALPGTPAGKGESPLGRGYLSAKLGQLDLDGAAGGAWGLDREGYLALEGYGGGARGWYFGGEIGRSGSDRGVTARGDEIRDIRFMWLEMNTKGALDLGHGMSFDAGLGWALLWVDGEEVFMAGGRTSTDPLADIGMGAQAFAGFHWRARRLLTGVELKYQWAADLIDVDYSNFRVSGGIGLVF